MNKNKSIHKRKNVSLKYKNGIFVQTRDEYLDKTNYVSPGHENKNDFYRRTVIVDSNINDELVLVPYTTHQGKSPKETISDYAYDQDRFGNKITLPSQYFKIRGGKMLSMKEVVIIKKNIFKTGPLAHKNRFIVHKHIKNRK